MGFVCDYQRETYCFLCANCLSTLACLFSRRLRRSRRRIQQSCIISQRKTGGLRLRFFCCFGFHLRKSARSAGDFGVSIEYSYVFILPQITQITQRNAASCIITQRKTGCLRLRLFCCFGVCLRNLRDLRETLGFLLSTLTCLFSRR